jgi:hypothetical protein
MYAVPNGPNVHGARHRAKSAASEQVADAVDRRGAEDEFEHAAAIGCFLAAFGLPATARFALVPGPAAGRRALAERVIEGFNSTPGTSRRRWRLGAR